MMETSMSDVTTTPRLKPKITVTRPPLYKVMLLNDDYTPREFVVVVLKKVFRMGEDQAYKVMMSAHRLGAAVVAVFTREIAETKADEANMLGREAGYPLTFSIEKDE